LPKHGKIGADVGGTVDSITGAAAAVGSLPGAVDFTYVGLSDELIKTAIASTQWRTRHHSTKPQRSSNSKRRNQASRSARRQQCVRQSSSPGFLADREPRRAQGKSPSSAIVRRLALAQAFNQQCCNCRQQVINPLPRGGN
jgi:hypothetical protein